MHETQTVSGKIDLEQAWHELVTTVLSQICDSIMHGILLRKLVLDLPENLCNLPIL